MKKLFHATLSMGRADTNTYECDSKTDLLNFFTKYSVAVVRNIKEIVFSKEYNINYTPEPFVQKDVYDRVVIQALSKSFSETYVLFNVKSSVTDKDIQREFKKLLINNEPIIDFVSITFYEKGVSPTNYNNLFQVQYKRNSKTYIENFYSKNWENVLQIARALIDGEITEIREFVHHNPKNKKDDGIGYYKAVTASLRVDGFYRSLKIPKVKHSTSNSELITDILKTFKVHGKTVINDELELKYS